MMSNMGIMSRTAYIVFLIFAVIVVACIFGALTGKHVFPPTPPDGPVDYAQRRV